MIGNTAAISVPLPDGLEFSGANQIGISFANNVTTNTVSVALVGFEY